MLFIFQVYVRQFGSSFMMGCFEKLARPWDVTKHGIDPDWNQIKVSCHDHPSNVTTRTEKAGGGCIVCSVIATVANGGKGASLCVRF